MVWSDEALQKTDKECPPYSGFEPLPPLLFHQGECVGLIYKVLHF